MSYNHQKIESKWAKKWEKDKLYQTIEDKKKPKYYILDMFPYPSGVGLHVGHPKGFIATDIFARAKMMQGYNVLHPMGWDAFGLPAENFALKNKVHPRVAVEQNIATFKSQLAKLGFSYDWEREINTTDPEFYKWTQWIFLQLFKKGLAYESDEPINWCPSCQTGLANEDLEDGKCERCGSEIERKPMRQWVLKITDYADRMLNDLEKLPDWDESIKEMQKNWIGRSEGAEIQFVIASEAKQSNKPAHSPSQEGDIDRHVVVPPPRDDKENKIKVFTTRPDTLFGATYMVVSPEHPLIDNLKSKIKNYKEVQEYIKKAKSKTDLERTDLAKEKTGVKLEGIWVVNPVNGEKLPVFVADYVLMGYGTGAIMAVPAHDERDWEFAKKYDLPIVQVVSKKNETARSYLMGGENITNEELLSLDIKILEETEQGHKLLEIPIKNLDKYEELIKNKMLPGFWNEYLGNEIVFLFKGKKGIVERIILKKDTEEKIDRLATEYNNEEGGQKKSVWGWLAKNDFYTNLIIHTEDGIAVNSGFLDGLKTKEAKEKMIKWLEKKKVGKRAVNYKLKDWVFSRQRYWGEPIPIIHCEECKKRIESEARTINFYNQETWDNLLSGQKTIETRALNPEEKDRYFGDIKKGMYLKAVNKLNNQEKYFEVKKVWRFKNLSELFKEKEILQKIFVDVPASLSELKKLYSFVPDYVERIDKNGLAAWEVEAVKPGIIPVPEKDLPVRLPNVENYEPSGTGESPLANITEWVNTKCSKCGGPAKRETNTMPQWAGSSWYYLRFIDPHDDKALVDKTKEKYWSPVDFYVGGAEHATRHLIYARFWHKFLYDIGAVNYEEPFTRLQHVGLILAEDGRKMSKRWGNVINPDDIVEKYGADAMRVYEMFMGPFSQAVAWSTNGLVGARKFLEKVLNFSEKAADNFENSKEVLSLLHQTIKKVGEDIEAFKFNTAVSAMMILINKLSEEEKISHDIYDKFLLILAPFSPHLAEELWEKIGHQDSIFKESWPAYDEKLARPEKIELVLQINGKVRARLEVSADISEEEARGLALADEQVKKWVENKEIIKIIFVPGKLINIVVK